MTSVADSLVSLSSSIGNNTQINNCIDRFINFDDDVKALERKYLSLQSRKTDIELQMQVVRNGEVIRDEVLSWLKNVQSISTDVDNILKKAERVTWCNRGCLGKRLCRIINDVKDIYDQGEFKSLVQRKPPRAIQFYDLDDLVGANPTKKEEILEDLMGNEVGIIGVYGIGGVGKTLIMKHVYNDLLKGTSFAKVVWVEVPYPLNVSELQRAIAYALNETLPEDGQEKWASALREIMEGMIERMQKFVLILDDVWEIVGDNFSLTKVGIPKPSGENRCKIVITSKLLDVLESLRCDKYIEMKLLSPEDSLNLFLDKANLVRDVVPDQSMQIIKRFVKECSGLPLTIVSTATSLIGVRGIEQWRNAYRESNDDLHDGASVTQVKANRDGTFQQLRVSYDRLENAKLKKCFLYCSLFRKGFAFLKKELIEGWIDEGLLIEEPKNRQVPTDEGFAVIIRLKKNLLLEEIDGSMNAVEMHAMAVRKFDSEIRYVNALKMHDVIREMAINCIGPSLGYMVKAGVKLTEVPDKHLWAEDLQKVSLMGNDIKNIPHGLSPKCPTLRTLILSHNPLSGIPESFFEELLGLKVLDISETYIEALPRSISNLEGLSALRLRMCTRLKCLPSLAKLRALKKLDLHKAAIDEVPQGMKNLKNLEYLDLSCPNLKIPEEMLSIFRCLPFFNRSS